MEPALLLQAALPVNVNVDILGDVFLLGLLILIGIKSSMIYKFGVETSE